MQVESARTRSEMAGIILTGGYSQRMGRDKALLPVASETPLTFVEHLASLLSPICNTVHLVARDETSGRVYAALPTSQTWQLIYDQVPGQGPLMGLYSGLQAISSSHALVLAVDQPFVQPALLSWLHAFPLSGEILIPRVQGIPQVLLARYPRAVLPAIEACLKRGRRDPRALLDLVPVRFLEEDVLRTLDPELHSFLNINTPEDLAQAHSYT
jgi:molybdenum cofactor guanylyltransferase